MTPKTFINLAAAAAGSVALAVMLNASKNRWVGGTAGGEAVMPALAQRAGDIAALQILQGDKTLTLQRQGDTWSLKERDGYKAQPDKVRALAVQLSNAQLAERKTQSAQRHSVLELEDPVPKDAKSRMVRVLDAKGGAIGELIVGKTRGEAFGGGKPGVYVRRPNETQTWLALGAIDAPVEAREWVDRRFLDLDAAKIASLTWAAPGEAATESLTIKRGAAKDGKEAALEFEGVPAGKKLKTSESADNIGRYYAKLDLDDVRKAVAADKDTKTGSATLALADGMTVVFEAQAKGEETWVTLTAKGEGDAKTAADALNARVQGWQYKVPSGVASTLFKTANDLFEAADAKG